MKVKHKIVKCKFDAEAEKTLDTLISEGWLKSEHFYDFESGFHLMVFDRMETSYSYTYDEGVGEITYSYDNAAN